MDAATDHVVPTGATLASELIARAAQLSVGAIYLYFRSKEDLYVSLIEDALTVFDVEMGQVREHVEVSRRLRETWSLMVRWAERVRRRSSLPPGVGAHLGCPLCREQLAFEAAAVIPLGSATLCVPHLRVAAKSPRDRAQPARLPRCIRAGKGKAGTNGNRL